MKNEKILKTVIASIAITIISITLIHIDNINIILDNQTQETINDNPENTSENIDNDSNNSTNPTDESNNEEDNEEDDELNIPVELCDLEPIDGGFEFENEPITDVYENEYDAYFHVFLGDMGSEEASVEYGVNNKYSLFTGTLFTDKNEGIYSAYKMKVYECNSEDDKGNCIYTSPTIKLKSKPQKFEVPLSGVDFLKIKFIFVNGDGGGPEDGFMSITHACLYDAKLIP